MMLGPGVPDPPAAVPRSVPKSRHFLDDFGAVCSEAVLGGLHHEYSLLSCALRELRVIFAHYRSKCRGRELESSFR